MFNRLFLKNYKEIILYSFLIILLFCSCFFYQAVYFSVALIMIMSLFFDINNNFKLIVFTKCFTCLFKMPNISYLYALTMFFIAVNLGLRLLINIFKCKRKINYIFLIALFTLIVYLILPIHSTSIKALDSIILEFALLYLLYEYRSEIKLQSLVRTLCYGLIISSLFALFYSVSNRLQNIMPFVVSFNYIRFSGLFTHPNHFASFTVLAISGIYVLRLKNKISLLEFFVLLIPLNLCGICTISRNFIFGNIIASTIFLIFYILKYKRKSYKFILACFILFCCCFAIVPLQSKLLLVRINVLKYESIQNWVNSQPPLDSVVGDVPSADENTEQYSPEWWEKVFNGEIRYDPGRAELWKLYFNDWKSNTKTIFFGRGINAVAIGTMSTHNLFLNILWQNGLVGLLLYLFALISIIKFKFLKHFKKYAYSLIMIASLLFIFMIESNPVGYIGYYFVIICISNAFTSKDRRVKVLYYNSSLSMGGTDTYMVNLIENANKNKFSFDVIIKSKENLSTDLYNRLQLCNCKITFLGNNLFEQLIKVFVFYYKNNNYDVLHINATSGAVGLFAYLGKDIGLIDNVIFHSHMGGNDNKNNFTDKIGTFLAKNFSDNLAACSDKASIFMYGENYIKNHKIHILNNAVNVSLYSFNKQIRDDYRNQLHCVNDFVILNVGRFVRQKNHDKLIDIFKNISDNNSNCKLILVGDGPLKTSIQDKVKKLNLNDKVLFLNNRTDVNCIMQAADVFVMTSLHEGLPIVAVEAQASGLPLILASTITQKTDITKNCTFVDLQDSESNWGKLILNCKKFIRKDTTDLIISSGYDEKSANLKIENLYMEKIDENTRF